MKSTLTCMKTDQLWKVLIFRIQCVLCFIWFQDLIAVFQMLKPYLPRNFLLFSTVKAVSALKHILFLSKNQTISKKNFQFWSTVRGKIKTEIALMCMILQTYKHQVQPLNGSGKKCCKKLWIYERKSSSGPPYTVNYI